MAVEWKSSKEQSSTWPLRAGLSGHLTTPHTQAHSDLIEKVHHKIKKIIFFLLPVVLFINLYCFGVSCLVLEILAVEVSAFFQILWD